VLSHLRKSHRLTLIGLFLILALLLTLWSSLAEAKEQGIWGEAKASFVHATRQAGAFVKQANRAFLKFFRKDVKGTGKEVGKGAIEAGKETRQAIKQTGKETIGNLKHSAQEINRNFRRAVKAIHEAGGYVVKHTDGSI